MTIENKKIELFTGNYTEYMARNKRSVEHQKEELEKQEIVLKNRLSEVVGRLSMPSKKDNIEELDREYYEILDALKGLKS
jgi:macrolide transport system ATP-binding/permease protein